ncbi:MFS transporter [Xylanibacillus composti]|uniref:Fosmidomycin resistance protein n=1 Tax=Xylanibacillus composti TaxID=1572762 RepID=A0A8J4H8H0_9BACL|nr:MFS transporter [Xylanibacillus composti]MDT9726172.1 MFS transporter [Xylanibacillus composti]GIQ70593.1 fosmidomycin resistance protein [Xylanibacillus composti]
MNNAKPAATQAESSSPSASRTVFPILFAISIVHLLNDTMQSTVSALFPILRDELSLTYTQIGIIALAMNLTASLLQPLIGQFADKRPMPSILPIGVCFTLIGIVGLALAPHYALILLSVTALGIGSAIFHPESSRVAYLAAGQRRGLAQSIFQVGGNLGSSLGPIMTALLFVHIGQLGVIWFVFVAITGILIQWYVAKWYKQQLAVPKPKVKARAGNNNRANRPLLSKQRVAWAMVILMTLVVSKNVYISSITSYYTFFLIDDYGVSIRNAQFYLFAFLAAAAVGTFLGGPMADRFGRRTIIWWSILGTAPFSLLLPYSNLFWSGIMAVLAGFILSSAFSIIVVYAQELLPGRIGFVSGLFFGLAFGIGGVGAAVLGGIADMTSISLVMKVSGLLPLLGVLAIWLPKDEQLRQGDAAAQA